jgi:ubiquinone biosynthesis protein
VELGALFRLPRTVKNLQRVSEILGVLAKYGWGDLVARLDVGSPTWRGRALLRARRRASEVADLTSEERVRRAFEELGPTFVKLGQVLATRPDLVPLALTQELVRLQDRVPPFPAAEARAVVEASLGRSLEEVFASFEPAPLAAASMAQVHGAVLPTGEEVVVKVRRPGIERVIHTDLEILRFLAELLEENAPETRRFAPRAIVEEFARAIEQELDFGNEAWNAARFAARFAGDPHVHVPAVFAALSSDRVLVLERIRGAKVSELAALEAAGIDRKRLARIGVDFSLTQIFEHGFFHADPHPGNLFALPGPVLVPIDLGMVGRLDRDTQDGLLELLIGLIQQDVDKLVRVFARANLLDPDVDLAALRRDGQELLDRWHAVPLGKVDVSTFLRQLFEVFALHRVRIPPDLVLMAKALATAEGVARTLDPEMDPIAAMRPKLLRLYLARLADADYLAKDVLRASRDAAELALRAPADVSAILAELRRGRFTLGARVEGLDEWVREQARSANRTALAWLLTGSLIGSAILLAAPSGPTVAGVPLTAALGLAGLALAGAGALVLGFGFLRSGRF